MKDLGARAFNYGYPMAVLIVATYNDDETVNVMNLHECTRTNFGDLVICIGEGKKTHKNIEKRGAFTLTMATRELMTAADYFGMMSGYQIPDKFERAGLKSVKSNLIDAPIIVGSKLVIECELIEFVKTTNFSGIIARIVNIAADESILNEKGKVAIEKMDLVIYDSFSSKYFTIGEEIGKAFGAGKEFLNRK